MPPKNCPAANPPIFDRAGAPCQWVLYGLAANPPHAGHWQCVRDLRARGYGVLVSPSYAHAFGKAMAPFETRLEWLLEAAAEFGADEDGVRIWPRERDAAAAKPEGARIYSLEMLRRAEAELGVPVKLAIGPDNANPAVFSRFHGHEAIAKEHGVVALLETVDVRSTKVRAKLAAGGGVDDELRSWVGGRIAPSVAAHFNAGALASKRAPGP